MSNCYLITPRGEIQKAAPKDGEAFSIRELQDLVDGFIDVVDIDDGLLLVFDVDGPEKDKLYNEKASELLNKNRAQDSDESEPLRFVSGNAIVCRRGMIKV